MREGGRWGCGREEEMIGDGERIMGERESVREAGCHLMHGVHNNLHI